MARPPACGNQSGRESGQATVELVALLPLLAVVALVAWQGVVAGHTWWVTGAAAREAARAAALGGDPERAARSVPGAGRAEVSRTADGGVRVRLGVPVVVGGGGWSAGSVRARARMEPQR